ncbi:MAG: chorismate mutase [Clostridia bacterium]|nr:chorismate mutase [Clostridia bacterium]
MTEQLQENKIKSLRAEIDVIDDTISALLKKRFSLVKKIGAIKKEILCPVADPSREAVILQKVSKDLDDKDEKLALKSIYTAIIKECTKMQK